MHRIGRIYLDDSLCHEWKNTFNCKVDQGHLIAMKLKLDVSCYLPNVHPKFQTDISKHVKKSCYSILLPFFKRVYKNNQTDMGTYSWDIPGKMSRKLVMDGGAHSPRDAWPQNIMLRYGIDMTNLWAYCIVDIHVAYVSLPTSRLLFSYIFIAVIHWCRVMILMLKPSSIIVSLYVSEPLGGVNVVVVPSCAFMLLKNPEKWTDTSIQGKYSTRAGGY